MPEESIIHKLKGEGTLYLLLGFSVGPASNKLALSLRARNLCLSLKGQFDVPGCFASEKVAQGKPRHLGRKKRGNMGPMGFASRFAPTPSTYFQFLDTLLLFGTIFWLLNTYTLLSSTFQNMPCPPPFL